MIAILIHSPSPIRHAAYETFLHLHVTFATLALVGVFYHLKIDKLPQLVYILICIGIWSYDRLGRLVRLIYRNCGRRMTRIRVQALPGGGGACRVDIELTRPWAYTPGSHAYIYIPWASLWHSHPFSIAWSNNTNTELSSAEMSRPTNNERRDSSSSSDSDDTISRTPVDPVDDTDIGSIETLISTETLVENPEDIPHNPRTNTLRYYKSGPDDIPWCEKNTISMIMSKRTGMTKTLWEMANRKSSKTLYLKALLEGKYGGHHGLYSYGMVVLISGGVGITHCIGWARELLRFYKEGRGVAKKVVLIWVVPDKEQYEWCRGWFDEIFATPGWDEFLTIQLYVTRPKGDLLVSPCSSVPAYAGRPDWESLFNRFVEQRLGTIGVTGRFLRPFDSF